MREEAGAMQVLGGREKCLPDLLRGAISRYFAPV